MSIVPRLLGSTRREAPSWFSFWNQPEGVHVSERHLQARYNAVVGEFLSAFPDVAGRRLLDYGCGEALASHRLVDAGIDLALYDRSLYFRERVQRRFGDDPRITVLDEGALADIPAGSLDYVLVCSVIQYLDQRELDELMRRNHALLRPGGVLVLADIIPRQLDSFSDTMDFLRYSARNRFLMSGLRTLYDLLSSNYRSHLLHNSLTRYDLGDLGQRLHQAGFDAERLDRNIGISQARRTMIGIRRA